MASVESSFDLGHTLEDVVVARSEVGVVSHFDPFDLFVYYTFREDLKGKYGDQNAAFASLVT